ncbi:MAG: hypothetical protein OHK0017_07760 [Patescibacteria group bacterium]
MLVALGRLQDVGMKQEGVRLTAETSGFQYRKWSEFAAEAKKNYLDVDTATGIREEVHEVLVEQEMLEGKMGGIIDADTILDPLYYFFGQATPVTALSATTWTMTRSNNIQLPTFSAVYERGAQGWMNARGCSIKSLELKWGQGEHAEFSAEFLGIQQSAISALTPSYAATQRYLQSRFAKLGFFSAFGANGIASAAAATYVDVQSATLKLENNTEHEMAMGTKFPVDVLAKQFSYELDFSFLLKTASLPFYSQFLNETNAGVVLDIQNTVAANIGSSTLKPRLIVEVAPSKIECEIKQAPNDFLIVDAKIKRAYSFTDALSVRATLQNSIASIT